MKALLLLFVIITATSCNKRDSPFRSVSQQQNISTDDYYVYCWEGYVFIGKFEHIIQVMDSTGKPMRCN